ncbi:MAG TPA: Uma2 family endonuclease, partial [Leptospiraceae bacterium]|nr:Uma2 family endonuclease [Leptospiraceae bacterium]
IKKEIYASADIPNYWIVNLNQKEIEVYSDPVLGNYRTVKNYTSGEKISIFGSELDVSVLFE